MASPLQRLNGVGLRRHDIQNLQEDSWQLILFVIFSASSKKKMGGSTELLVRFCSSKSGEKNHGVMAI